MGIGADQTLAVNATPAETYCGPTFVDVLSWNWAVNETFCVFEHLTTTAIEYCVEADKPVCRYEAPPETAVVATVHDTR
jgi:hypothetical protein